MNTGFLSSICMAVALLAGCASTPDVALDGAAPTTAATVRCRNADAPTGSSIVRRDCSGNPDAQSVDAKELMESKRFSLPTIPMGAVK